MLTSTMVSIGPARTRLCLRSRQLARGPGGPYCGRNRIQIATVIMNMAGEEQARQDAGEQQPADRLLGQQAVDDECGARRNQDAERAAGGDHAGGEPVAVVVAAHLGQADLAHGHRRGDARSRHGGKARAGEDGGVREPAAHMADPGIGGGIEVARHPGHRSEIAHQHEQRDDGEIVDRRILVGIGAERRERGMDSR